LKGEKGLKSLVSLVLSGDSEKEIRESLHKALSLIDFKFDKPVRSVAIKPNLCYYWNASTGYTTDTRIVSGIIDWVREKYGAKVNIKIVEADATAMRTNLAFLMLGYEKLAKIKKVDLFNLSEDSIIEKKVFINGHEIKFKIPRLLLESDLFINVPKLKIMRETYITCAMKNMFGCIASPRKIIYHPILNEAIVGINKILRPHLTIVDGLVALGRFPIKLGLIMASEDPFSIDWVASQIMGYNPYKVKILNISLREKLGDSKKILVCGENIKTFKDRFPKETFLSTKRLWKIQLRLLKLYQRIVGDIIPPILQES